MTQLVQRPMDALSRGTFRNAKRAADFRERAVAEKAEENRFAVGWTQGQDRLIQDGADPVPVTIGRAGARLLDG